MNLTIPSVGDILTLSQDWEFSLQREYRNYQFVESFCKHNPGYVNPWLGKNWGGLDDCKNVEFMIPAGSKIAVDRIYIRKGKKDYDSITFRVPKGGISVCPKFSGRFWVQLSDANKIVFS